MAFDDLPLERPTAPPGALAHDRRGSPTRWIVAAAAIIVAGSLLALWWIVRERPESATPVPAAATTAAVTSHRPNRQPIDLPAIDASDDAVRSLAAFLSHHPLFERLLATKGLIRAVALVVQQIGDGKTPADPLAALRPATRLTLTGAESGVIDPKSYARWTPATQALVSVAPKDAAQLYVNVKLLLDDAYRDLGHPNANFDEGVVAAMQMLFSTPAVSPPPELVRRPNYFEYTDPALRALRPVQKEFLLLGPDNRRQVEAWLHALAAQLDLKTGS
jgi:hypothetical protein